MIQHKTPRASFIPAMLIGLFLAGLIFPAVLFVQNEDDSRDLLPRYAADAPILVDGDGDWSSVPDITGDGSPGNPYLIKDKFINAGGSGDCIRVQNTTNYFIIRNCTLTNAGAKPASTIYLWNVSNGVLEQNNCSESTTGNGILSSYVSNVTILENNVTKCDYAIANYWCSNISIIGNNASSCTTAGVQVDTNSTNVLVENNIICNDDFGIVFSQNSTLSIIRNNYVGYCDFIGIYLFRARNNSVTYNRISGCSMGGIYLSDNCHNNSIDGNLVTSNPGEGIYLTTNCLNNTISRNNLTSNTLHGVELLSTCNGNIVYLNRFVQNTAGNGRDNGQFNIWDNGSRGNYWSNYTGKDDNDDGIGDAAWPIPGSAGAQDNFPLWRDTEHPIRIIGDAGWAAYRSAGNCTGSGTLVDPYVISELWYDAEETTSAIWIEDSTVHFIIWSCTTNNSAPAPYAGIHLTNVSNGQVIQNDCSNNSGAGILVENNCSNIVVDNNHVDQNGFGIILYQQGHNINVTRNNVIRHWSAGTAGINAGGSFLFTNVTIANNNVSHSTNFGINVWAPSANVSIYDNHVENHTSRGIRLMNVNTTHVWNNTIKNCQLGLYFQSGNSFCDVRANTITENIDGIYMEGCNLSRFEGNSITGNTGRGINWLQGHNNTLVRNNVTGNSGEGILLWVAHNNSILQNHFTGNGGSLYSMNPGGDACNNTIAGNYFQGSGVQVYVDVGMNSNRFYGNNFSTSVNDWGSWNEWDNGSTGNFWSAYAGADADDNFVGDTPYTVAGTGAQDHFPFCDDGDDVAPLLYSTGFVDDQLCGPAAPAFTLGIFDAYLISEAWVSYDGGFHNWTCGTSGTLPQWTSLPNGTVVATFWANDTAGHEAISIIAFLRKDIDAPSFISTGLTAGQLLGNATPGFVLETIEGNPTGQWWYSFDGGATNTSCGQSGTLAGWDLLPNGTVTVRFFTNDTVNNVGWVDVLLQRDCAPPVISATGLTTGASYTSAPTITLAIAEANRDAVWYSVDGGATSHMLAGLSGTIDAAVWASLSSGNVQVTFWCNDTLGNTASVMVIIVKASSDCENCLDPTIYWIVGGAVAVGAIVAIAIMVKRRKNRAFYPDEVSASK